jgi:hypothetical protein
VPSTTAAPTGIGKRRTAATRAIAKKAKLATRCCSYGRMVGSSSPARWRSPSRRSTAANAARRTAHLGATRKKFSGMT